MRRIKSSDLEAHREMQAFGEEVSETVSRSDNLRLPQDPEGTFKDLGQIASELVEKLWQKRRADK